MILSQSELMRLVSDRRVYRPDGVAPTIDLVSIGLHLGDEVIKYKEQLGVVDLPSNLETEPVENRPNGFIEFPPQSCLLAATKEVVEMPLDLMGFVQTKGTIARGFVTVHLCDGQVDPGYRGRITLELVNLSRFTYQVRPGVAVAQLFLHKITTPLTIGYNGRYQLAEGPTSMRV